MTPERAREIWNGYRNAMPAATNQLQAECAILAACAEAEREARYRALTEASEIVRSRLVSSCNQRAVSWHECADTQEAILALRDRNAERGG